MTAIRLRRAALVLPTMALVAALALPADAADDPAAGARAAAPAVTAGAPGAVSGQVAPRLRQPLHVDTTTQAHAAVAAAKAAGRPGVAKNLQVIASAPQAMWVGDWFATADVRAEVARYVRKARAAGRTPQVVLYAIPGRDCGSHSGGGLDERTYPGWVAQVALGLRDGAVDGRSQALVMLEPDSLMMDCGSAAFDARRNRLMRDATARLAATGAWVYLDGGHSSWRAPADTASRLRAAGAGRARGFFTNVSNYNATSREKTYARAVAARLASAGLGPGHRHYVIDTSRNGTASANGEWCNPRGQGLGVRPRALAAGGALDALLWVKHPGESDGACNGGPGAGQWWEDVALELVRNRVR